MMRAMLLAATLLLSGCVMPHSAPSYWDASDSRFIQANYAAAEALIKSPLTPLDRAAPILVATLASIDNLNASSTLGRLVSEQIASRLATQGYAVKEVKLRDSLLIKRGEGEFLLTRELQNISTSHNAQAVVVGTYTDAGEFVYLNLKLVDPRNVVIGAHDYALPLNQHVGKLLGRR